MATLIDLVLAAAGGRRMPWDLTPIYPPGPIDRDPLRPVDPTPVPPPREPGDKGGDPGDPDKGGRVLPAPPPKYPEVPTPRPPMRPVDPVPVPPPRTPTEPPDKGNGPSPPTPPAQDNFSKGQVRPEYTTKEGGPYRPIYSSDFNPWLGAGAKGGTPSGGGGFSYIPEGYSSGQPSQWDPLWLGSQGAYAGGPYQRLPSSNRNVYSMTGANAATGYDGPARYGVVGGQGGYGIGMVGPEYSGPIFDDAKQALKALRQQRRRMNRPARATAVADPTTAQPNAQPQQQQQKGGQPQDPSGMGLAGDSLDVWKRAQNKFARQQGLPIPYPEAEQGAQQQQKGGQPQQPAPQPTQPATPQPQLPPGVQGAYTSPAYQQAQQVMLNRNQRMQYWQQQNPGWVPGMTGEQWNQMRGTYNQQRAEQNRQAALGQTFQGVPISQITPGHPLYQDYVRSSVSPTSY